ncbi:MAG: hypothetical protein F4X26_01570 [Chloroflexi bacterium]|nr:hypothetical protein [Chloroflexota bacterium]
MSSATRILNAVRALRDEADFDPEEADAIGVAAVEVAEAAADRIADRMLIRLGAWTLGVVLGTVSIATAIIIAVIQLSLD